MPEAAVQPNAFQLLRPRGNERPVAAEPKKITGKPPMTLPGSFKYVIDACGRWRPAEQPLSMRGFAIENAQQSRASRDKRSAIVKGGL